MSLGKRIRALRDEKGYTREDVASKMQVSFSTVQKWENDERTPTVETLKQIAVFFGTTVAFLLGENPSAPSTIESDWPELVPVLRRAGTLATVEERKRIARIIRANFPEDEDKE